MNLSKIQREALKGLNEKPQGAASAYDLKFSTGFQISVATMRALQSRHLAQVIPEPGNMAFPQNAIYRITAAGRNEAQK